MVNTLVAAGHSLTVFEELYEEDELVCEHKDPNDSEQTLIVLEPKISTFAFDAKDSDSHVSPSTNAHVIDQVSYDNLIANEAYQLIGFIVNPSIASYHTFSTGDLFTQETLQEVRDKLKVDNELFSIATSTFSPEKSEGSTTVDFELNTEALAGKTFVVFEYLVQDDYIIATHTEPGDTKQQFSIETPPEAPSPPTGLGKTYDNPLPLSLGLVCTSALGIALVSRRIRLAKSRKEDILSRIVIP